LRPNEVCTLDESAAAYNVSVNQPMKVGQQAAHAGEMHTVRGQRGGIWLARALEAINVGVVLRRTEPDLHIAPCFGSGTACCIEPSYVLQGALGDALTAFLAVLDGNEPRGRHPCEAPIICVIMVGTRRTGTTLVDSRQ
jgi:Rrf2 family nitric oxide-sensitive transcriptional repressor